MHNRSTIFETHFKNNSKIWKENGKKFTEENHQFKTKKEDRLIKCQEVMSHCEENRNNMHTHTPKKKKWVSEIFRTLRI